ETWKFQGGAWTNLTAGLTVTPPSRTGASMGYDVRDGYVVLFGGQNSTGALNDTWTFSYGRWSSLSIPTGSPPARVFGSLTYDIATSSILLFGGTGSNGAPLSDTWSFASGLWSNVTATSGTAPPARSSAGFSYDTPDGVAVLFGGTGRCGQFCGDTWTYSASHWLNVTASSGTAPTGRTGAAMAYDDGRALVLLFGGLGTAPLGDTWGFSHGRWAYLAGNSSASPGTRVNASAAFDVSDSYLLLYGGHTSGSGKIGPWAFLSPLSVSVVPQRTSLIPGQADQFVATTTGGFGAYNVSWNFGDGTAVVSGPSAGHTYTLPGTFTVTATASDALGVTASVAVTVSVQNAPLTVALLANPAHPHAGQAVTLTATATGGTAPYSFRWSGDVQGCSAPSGAVLTCVDATPGSFVLGVSVADGAGHSASSTTTVIVSSVSGGLSSSGSPSAGAAASGFSGLFTSVYIALAVMVACAVGVMTYRAGRRREAAKAAMRPLCYAVPAWSETPPEIDPEAGREGPVRWDGH
ncbi:MAG TPA: kelch repeat-containing protein, partial [Thermoplasmata archaeon]